MRGHNLDLGVLVVCIVGEEERRSPAVEGGSLEEEPRIVVEEGRHSLGELGSRCFGEEAHRMVVDIVEEGELRMALAEGGIEVGRT